MTNLDTPNRDALTTKVAEVCADLRSSDQLNHELVAIIGEFAEHLPEWRRLDLAERLRALGAEGVPLKH